MMKLIKIGMNGLPVSEVGLIMFAATTPHIIFILIVVYLALVGF